MIPNSNQVSRPLFKKLGLREGLKVKFINPPNLFFDLIPGVLEVLEVENDNSVLKDYIHLFTKSEEELKTQLTALRKEIKQNGAIWVSWPKKSSKVSAEVDANIIRDYAKLNQLVELKLCSVDSVWSALKFVIPVKLRK